MTSDGPDGPADPLRPADPVTSAPSAGPEVPGLPGERTSLTWWRTAQTAIAGSLVLAKSNLDHPAHAVLGWIAMGLALAVAAAAWLAARQRAEASTAGSDDAATGAAPSSSTGQIAGAAVSSTGQIAVVAGLTVALAATVLIEVIVAA